MREDTLASAPVDTSLPLSLLGEMLVAARKERGMTQQDLAERLGMLQEAVARMEREKFRGVGLERLVRVQNALGVEVRIELASIADDGR